MKKQNLVEKNHRQPAARSQARTVQSRPINPNGPSLAKSAGHVPGSYALADLEEVVYEVMAVLQLLGHRVAQEIQDRSEPGSDMDLVGGGMVLISQTTSDKLKKAFGLAWDEVQNERRSPRLPMQVAGLNAP